MRNFVPFLPFLAWMLLATPLFGEEKDAGPSKDRPKQAQRLIKVSKETTFITEPLREDGTVDFLAAINERFSRGVTAENNAAVVFWRVYGAAGVAEEIRENFFERLGMDVPPEEGDYFVSLAEFIDGLPAARQPRPMIPGDPDSEAAADPQNWLVEAGKAPWTKAKYPLLAEWLEKNEKRLNEFTAGTQRTNYFQPLASTEEGAPLFAALLPGIAEYRDMARALTARAMLKLGAGKVDEAWQGLLAVHRLARHVGSGPTLIESLVGIAIEGIAAQADEALLSHGKLSAKQLDQMSDGLAALPPLAGMVEKIEFTERLMFVDAVWSVARGGVENLSHLGGNDANSVVEKILSWGLRFGVDWNVVLKLGNEHYDKLVAAGRIADPTERQAALDEFNERLERLRAEATDKRVLLQLLAGDPAVRKIFSRQIGKIFLALLMPALDKALEAEVRGRMQAELTQLAVRLVAHRARHGEYPERLAELEIKDGELPRDRFTGKALNYRRLKDGVLLYSVGPNGADDNGQTREEGAESDDVRVRVNFTP